MRRQVITGLVGILGALALVTVAARAPAEGTGPGQRVVVDVGTFRSTKGSLGCRLFRGGAGFPESGANTVGQRVRVGGPVTRCVFEGLPPGTYAVSVMHDENDNDRLDKNFLGIPTEGYGVSNNKTHAMRAPTWDEAKFVVVSGRDVGLGIALRY